jgi:hypothetical protein
LAQLDDGKLLLKKRINRLEARTRHRRKRSQRRTKKGRE